MSFSAHRIRRSPRRPWPRPRYERRDRHRAQDEMSGRHQPHPHAETPARGESDSPPTEPESPQTLGRLIDVRA